MRTRLWSTLGTAALLGAGCNDSSKIEDAVDRRVDLPPEPENGVQFVLPEMEIEASTEKMVCWYTTFPSETDQWVQTFQVFQGEGGHHLVGFLTFASEDDGTVKDCSSPADMATWLPLLTGESVEGFDLPPGYAVKVPAEAKLVFQVHYVNASDDAIRVRDVVNLHYAPADETITPVGTFVQTTLDFDVPPGASSVTFECPVEQAIGVYQVFGHMHEAGAWMTISAGPPGGLETIYDVQDWDPSYRDRAPIAEWEIDQPLLLGPGDVIRVNCNWQNDGTETLGFPAEMCASLFWFHPAPEPLVCTSSAL